ncbi:hypothetical protein ACTXJX_17280 [Glutamicibacter ardleyensis]|uniref:hypothetical protein n=1 Tax=Glutamicibacter ardleyensis TaxID=225894 RepID=UPI003FD28441
MDNIPGLADSPLNDVAGMWLWIGFIVCVVGLVTGALIFAFGKIRGRRGFTQTGLIAVPIALVGAVVLGGINGAVAWSSTNEFTMQALPKDAQSRSITIEKVPPKVTCSETIKYTHTWKQDEESKKNRERANELWPKLVSDEDAAKHPEIRGLEYRPQGPDCSKNNEVAQTCTNVIVWVEKENSKPMRPGDQIPDAMDPDKHEYQARGSKDC